MHLIMKPSVALFALAFCVALRPPSARCDPLDDMIAGMRSGATAPANAKGTITALFAAESKTYTDSIVDLYLGEIKDSIVDGVNNGGWPFRSFLVEMDPDLRAGLTKGLEARYKAKPDSILAYALICPALYGGDEARVEQLEQFLNANDPFLFKVEQANVDKYWRPFVATMWKGVLAPQVLFGLLPYVASSGTDRDLPAKIANPLGLAPAGATWQYRIVVIQGSGPQDLYGFGVNRGSDQDILLTHSDATGVHVFRAGRDGKVVAALNYVRSTGQVTVRNLAEAQADFVIIWKFWYDNLDSLTSTPSPK